MPQQTLEESLEKLLQEYIQKDWKEKVVRDTLVKDIMLTINNFNISQKKGCVVMTPDAASYQRGDKIKSRPKSL